jgi:hypothetical protein
MKKILIPIFASIALIYGCDKVDNPVPKTDDIVVIDTGIIWDDSLFVESNTTLRKIVLEEFTGHRCSQCPGGAIKLDQLVTTYGSQLIPVSLHSGFFAEPYPAGSGKFETDHRTDIGEAFNNFSLFAPVGYPAGMVSRREFNGKLTNGKDDWETVILDIINNDPTPKVKINITSLYNDSLRTIKETIGTEWLSSETSSYKLQVYIVEDHVLDWQLDGTSEVSNYDHKHVMRKALNTDFGTDILSSNIGDTATQEFTTIIPAEWEIDNCIIVALVYDATTYEILQGEEIHIKE